MADCAEIPGHERGQIARPRDAGVSSSQITARLEQIHHKLLQAEDLTVGDGVFLFDLVTHRLRRA